MDYLYFFQLCREGSLKWLNNIMFLISEGGVTLAIAGVLFIYWAMDKQAGKKILFGFTSAVFVSNTVKNIACVSRPWILDSRLHVDPKAAKGATGYSFPSGHSTTASSTYGGMGLWQKKNTTCFILFYVLVFAILFSRNWLGCHTWQDVAAGFLVGTLFMILSFNFLDKVESGEKSDIVFFIVNILVCTLIIVFTMLKSYPEVFDENKNMLVNISEMKSEGLKQTANYVGVLCGWIIEKRFIKYEIPEEKIKRIFTGLIGILIFGFLYLLLSVVFKNCNVYIGGFIKHFILFFWAVAGYPAVVSRTLKK